MALTKVNIELIRGDDESRLVHLNQQQPDGTLIPLDLTTVARFDLHGVVGNKTVLVLSSENGLIEVLNATAGELVVHFPHSLTENAKWLEAQYDLQLTLTSGRIKTVLEGKIKLKHDYTQRQTAVTNGGGNE